MRRDALKPLKSRIATMVVAAALGTASAAPLLAAGGGGGDDDRPPPTCAKGQVYDSGKKTCVKASRNAIPDDQLTEYAYALAKAGRYEEALAMLDLLGNPETPRALNYRGYATRKLGRTEEGISYYLKSVALDPNYAQVREYLGEAYVIQGKVDLARAELTRIEAICGNTTCEEYEDLDEAIRASKS